MKITAEQSGTGKLTAAELIKELQEVPGNAIVRMRISNDPRDGDYWTLTAEWGKQDEDDDGVNLVRPTLDNENTRGR